MVKIKESSCQIKVNYTAAAPKYRQIDNRYSKKKKLKLDSSMISCFSASSAYLFSVFP